MKRISLVFACVLFSVYPVLAQVGFHGGLSGGAVTSQISGDGLGGWNKFGYAAGAQVDLVFSEKSLITFGMQYITKGSMKPADVNNGDYNEFAYKLTYIDVPLMYGFKRDPWQFNVGIYAGVLLNQKAVSNGGSYALNPPFEDLDLGATGGVLYRAGTNWGFELRGESSMIPTRPSPSPTNAFSYYEQGNYNQVLQLMIHYFFGKE